MPNIVAAYVTPRLYRLSLTVYAFIPSLVSEGIKAYTVKENLYSLGVTYAATIFGNQVKTYDPERTVCDILRSRSGIEEQVFQDALKMYVRRRDKDIGRLIGYAEKLRVKNIAVHYISLLLP